ncbi:Cfr10I/Bse634I family restriction endonuclease [Paenibacillus glacialis]|uniref:Uncharacterized protein n=1 Tax=Paenibacillus glacialis TaxID=494026 RepID=A0A168F6J3_9BACL|nr:Cfr10I/Bse634I family restriction endonuclease [Paenibacillus glacialis]OAB35907.1 hypothetical protein PGLA_20960 [Paenibacillus glacialis]
MNLYESKSVEKIEGGPSNLRIKPIYALEEVFNNTLPTGPIKIILDNLEQHIRNAAKAKDLDQPSLAAFSNVRGLWFEIIISVYAWNYRINNGLSDCFIIKMPNMKTYDFRRIFDNLTLKMLDQLEGSLKNNDSKIRLIPSNPDMILVHQKGLISNADDLITNLSEKNVEKLTRLYHEINGRCEWSSIFAGIGLTTSMRPDRRLQLVYEGNILKSIFAHLSTRHWNNKVSFQYYGASSVKHSNADDEAFQTAATHTIVNVNSVPERAVDGIFSLQNTDDINKMLDEITRNNL